MHLVDTSAWIHCLRPKGDAAVRERVAKHTEGGAVCWCSMVRLELWNGARGAQEKKVLRAMEDVIPELEIDDAVWEGAIELGRRARAKGVTAPASDVLIAACAKHHGVRLVHADQHLAALMKL